MRLDLPGRSYNLKELGRLLPRAIGLIDIPLAPLLIALCVVDLNALVRNIR